MMELVSLLEKGERPEHSLHLIRSQQEGYCLHARKGAFTKN